MSDNYFFKRENYNEETMKLFAQFLDANDLYVIKSRPHTKKHFALPNDCKKREELLGKIVEALNDGFYSSDSCVAYLYELVGRYQDDYDPDKKEKGKGTLDLII